MPFAKLVLLLPLLASPSLGVRTRDVSTLGDAGVCSITEQPGEVSYGVSFRLQLPVCNRVLCSPAKFFSEYLKKTLDARQEANKCDCFLDDPVGGDASGRHLFSFLLGRRSVCESSACWSKLSSVLYNAKRREMESLSPTQSLASHNHWGAACETGAAVKTGNVVPLLSSVVEADGVILPPAKDEEVILPPAKDEEVILPPAKDEEVLLPSAKDEEEPVAEDEEPVAEDEEVPMLANEAGKNCESLSQGELTCRKADTIESCRDSLEALGLANAEFHVFPSPSDQYPGGCSVRSSKDKKPHVWWNSDSNSMPARKMAAGFVGWMPICTCDKAGAQPLTQKEEEDDEEGQEVAKKDDEEVFEEDDEATLAPATTEEALQATTEPLTTELPTTVPEEPAAEEGVQHVQVVSEVGKTCEESTKDGLTCGRLPTAELCRAAGEQLYADKLSFHVFEDAQAIYPGGCVLRSTFDKKPHVWFNADKNIVGARKMANGSLGWVPICGCYKA